MTDPPDLLELVANIWPIVDDTSGLIQRVAARAYALPAGSDSRISDVLLGLAATDFVMAKQYGIPKRFTVQSEFAPLLPGTMRGVRTLGLKKQFPSSCTPSYPGRCEVSGR